MLNEDEAEHVDDAVVNEFAEVAMEEENIVARKASRVRKDNLLSNTDEC